MYPSVFDPELSSIAVAETGISELDGEAGKLRVRGFSIDELAANATYEEAVWVVLNGRLPTDGELSEFRAELAAERALPEDVRTLVRAGAAHGRSAMEVLRMGLAATDLEGTAADPYSAALRVIASAPTVTAAYWRCRQGLDPLAPRDDLGHTANFLYMLSGTDPTAARVEGLETFLTTIIEHGLNPSTFAARIVASTGADPLSAATAAVGTLLGPRHGGALETIFETFEAVTASTDIEEYVREAFETDGSLPGFGHSVYRTRDPRAEILADAAHRACTDVSDEAFVTRVEALEAAAEAYLTEHYPEQQMHATVDFYATALLSLLDVPPDLFTATFAVGRTAGWMAHYLEQRDSDALLRPRTRYVGPSARPWVERSNRYVTGGADPPSPDALAGVSSVLSTLSEPTRLELLFLLYESSQPLSYSALRARSSIDDNGRFNYHLRQLREMYVTKTDAGYALTDVGRSVVEMLVDEDQLFADGVP